MCFERNMHESVKNLGGVYYRKVWAAVSGVGRQSGGASRPAHTLVELSRVLRKVRNHTGTGTHTALCHKSEGTKLRTHLKTLSLVLRLQQK